MRCPQYREKLMYQAEVLNRIVEERKHQDKKWGSPQSNTLPEWMTILGEEFGEACQEVLRVAFVNVPQDNLLNELVQVAAVCVAALEYLDDVVILDHPNKPL